ncbi:MAG: hypothetical protein IK104_07220 [Clostridia bacterium]|nr:hypothetical protein [Clostridia bacterium]
MNYSGHNTNQFRETFQPLHCCPFFLVFILPKRKTSVFPFDVGDHFAQAGNKRLDERARRFHKSRHGGAGVFGGSLFDDVVEQPAELAVPLAVRAVFEVTGVVRERPGRGVDLPVGRVGVFIELRGLAADPDRGDPSPVGLFFGEGEGDARDRQGAREQDADKALQGGSLHKNTSVGGGMFG